MTHAVSVTNRRKKGEEGLSAYAGWKGKEFVKPLVTSESVCCTRLRCQQGRTISTSDGKRERGWVRLESGESLIGASEGVTKASDFRRKQEDGGRWNVEDVDKLAGVPWEPYPGGMGQLS